MGAPLPQIALPAVGAKTDISMDRRLSFIPKGAVTSAAAQGGGMLRAVIDKTTAASDVWADTAYR
jgi:hypothetical protein